MTRDYVINVDELPGGQNASTFDGHVHGAQVPGVHPPGRSHGDGVAGVTRVGPRIAERDPHIGADDGEGR
jgi:hypothetical protein